jgi:Xaa-Pro aminopeptidase
MMKRSTTALAPLLLVLAAPSMRAQEAGRYEHYNVYDTDLLPRSEYAARRARVLEQLAQTSAMLVRSADEKVRSNDVDYPYRQRNNMLYLTGVEEPGSAILLVGHPLMIDGRQAREILFVAERDPSKEVWTGITMGPSAAAKVSGIDVVLPYSQLRGILDTLLPSLSMLFYDDWAHGMEREPLTGTLLAWDREMKKNLPKEASGLNVRPAGALLNPMRMIKSPAEIAMMRRAIDASVQGHLETIRQARPGMHEYELQAIMEYTFRRLGSESPGYPSIVGSGPNSCVLHYESNRRKIEAGEMVLMDCGAEYHGYSADVTRTFPMGGHFTQEQRAIYDIVYEAQEAGIEQCRVGNDFRDPHRKATAIIAAGLMNLGIIKSPSDVDTYFMHGTSHYLGMDVHDVGRLGTLSAGMVLTVEPGIYIPAGSPCDPKWWNTGIRIEDDILVTDDGPVNLSGALPRKADDIEQLMRKTP